MQNWHKPEPNRCWSSSYYLTFYQYYIFFLPKVCHYNLLFSHESGMTASNFLPSKNFPAHNSISTSFRLPRLDCAAVTSKSNLWRVTKEKWSCHSLFTTKRACQELRTHHSPLMLKQGIRCNNQGNQTTSRPTTAMWFNYSSELQL